MLDIHCHILPGVDDGSGSLSESLAMLDEAQKSGIDRIACTPHCRDPWFNPYAMHKAYDTLRFHANAMGVQIVMGYEVYWKKLIDLGIDRLDDLTIGNSRYLLLELPYEAMPMNWRMVISKLLALGFCPIIAHPERNAAIQKDVDLAYELKRMGCRLQLSADFVSAGKMSKRRRVALRMLKSGIVDYIASDAHGPSDYADYRMAIKLAHRYSKENSSA